MPVGGGRTVWPVPERAAPRRWVIEGLLDYLLVRPRVKVEFREALQRLKEVLERDLG